MICTVMLCVNYHQKQVIHHKMLLDQRILRTVWMMPLHSGGISLTGHCTVVVWFLRGCHELYSMNSLERTWNQGDSSQCDNKNNISIEPCERIEADDAYDRMLDRIAGTPATEKPWQELLIFLLMISLEQVGLKWNNVSWLDSEDISKLALKTGMIWHLQDREFEGKKNSKQDRTSRWANRRPLMNWRRFLSKEIRRKISIVPLQCTPCTEAFWDRKIGCRVGHNFSVAANFPDVHSKAACPTIRDAKALNKLARQLKSSVLATHGTVADNWISWCLFSKQWRCMFTKRHGSVLIRIAWAIDEGRNVVWKLDWFWKPKDRTDCALHYCGWSILLHDVFWLMPVSLSIVDGPIWWSCKNPHGNWCEEPCYNSKNNSFTWTKGDNSHDSYVEIWKLVQEAFIILLIFQLRIV